MRGNLHQNEVGTIPIEVLKKTPGYPSDKELSKGPTVVIECPEEIPCNPCETICRKSAIIVGDPITNLPRVIPDNCDACGRCIAICPGLAIFMVDNTYSQKEARVCFPYEYLPLPSKGDIVHAVNRKGKIVCEGRVIQVSNPQVYDHTAVITIVIPKEFSKEVRGIQTPAKER